MRLWGDVLRRVPESRLLLKYRSLTDPGTRDIVAGLLARHGIPRDRLDLLPHAPTIGEHLGTYAQIDIALDPTPYNGTTTTCEAMWMGVPVITLAGTMHHSRVGASLLTAVNLGELVARSSDDYVRLAGDRTRLARMRQALRERMRESTLMDPRAFTQNLEEELRRAWNSPPPLS
jgi:predicted O-linked N-acetylglucosamine transferase (SPINDLY family)